MITTVTYTVVTCTFCGSRHELDALEQFFDAEGIETPEGEHFCDISCLSKYRRRPRR